MNDLHNSHRMGRIMLNGVAKGQTPKLNTGTRRQASDLCSNAEVSEPGGPRLPNSK